MRAILVSRDLLFISKVREVAAAGGHELTVVKSEQALSEALTGHGVLLIDVEKSPIALERIAHIISSISHKSWRCFSFFSHVHHDLGSKAQGLGLGEVMPRSQFVRRLPDILSSL